MPSDVRLVLVNEGLSGIKRINSFDIQSVRKAYAVQTKPDFSYKPKFSAMQYSDRFVGWLFEQYQRADYDPETSL